MVGGDCAAGRPPRGRAPPRESSSALSVGRERAWLRTIHGPLSSAPSTCPTALLAGPAGAAWSSPTRAASSPEPSPEHGRPSRRPP
eukprot:scaffold71136_cov23-Tisochrysis_lutea.AAC.1